MKKSQEGVKYIVICEGMALPLVKMIFYVGAGLVISGGKNSNKGILSPSQFNLSIVMKCIFHVNAYKIVNLFIIHLIER